jgi:thiamine pyrophosphokinase
MAPPSPSAASAASSAPSARRAVVVFAAGDPSEIVDPDLPPGAFVIAADSGVELAQALGWPVDLAVGDFDSVQPDALAAAEAAGARVERHPPAKDATDLELALDAAAALDPTEIVVVGGAGGRMDHLVGGLLALAGDASAGALVRAQLGPARVHVVRPGTPTHLAGRLGELVTLLAVHGPADGVTTDGLLYPLRGETLHPGSTRGVSNEMTSTAATVEVGSGVVLAVLPGGLGTHHLLPPNPTGDRP